MMNTEELAKLFPQKTDPCESCPSKKNVYGTFDLCWATSVTTEEAKSKGLCPRLSCKNPEDMEDDGR